MDNSTFGTIFQWVIGHGYPLLFLAMFVEGPIVTAAAAMGAAFGYFNIWIIFGLALLGDLVADLLYYSIGYFGRLTLVERWGHRVGLSHVRLKKIERLLTTHRIKTVAVLKLTPFVPTPGFMLAGAMRLPVRMFMLTALAVTLPRTIIFMLIGYYFGYALTANPHLLENASLVLFVIVIIIIACSVIYGKFSQRVAKNIEEI